MKIEKVFEKIFMEVCLIVLKKIFLIIILTAFVFVGNICFADHSKEILVFKGTADEFHNTGNQIFSWYVSKNAMKFRSDKKIAFAHLFAYDENDKWISKLDLDVKFSLIPSPKKNGKYRLIRWIDTYEEYVQNNRKFYQYVKKDNIYGNMYEIMKEYINFSEMIPMDNAEVNEIEKQKLEYVRIIEKEKIINSGIL